MQARAVHLDGTETPLTHLASQQIREHGKMTMASIQVPRDEADPLVENDDEVYLYDDRALDTDFVEFPTDRLKRHGNASHENGYVSLEDASTDFVEWYNGVAAFRFVVEYDMEIRATDEEFYFEFFKADVTPNARGYLIELDESADSVALWERNDSGGLTREKEVDFTVETNTVYNVVVDYDYGDITVEIDGSEVLSASGINGYWGPYTFWRADGGRLHAARIEYDEFGGVLGEIKRQGSEATLIVDSFERRAIDGKPTSGDEVWDGVSDRSIIEDAVESIDELSKGKIEETAASVSWTFSHVSQAKKIRSVEKTIPGHAFYRPNKHLGYIEQPSRETGVTMSPADGSIGDDFRATRESARQVTHLRALGAGEGSAQLSSEVVADSYSSEDPQKWATVSNKDITSQDTLDEFANVYIDELQQEHIEVKHTQNTYDVDLGDVFTIDYPEEDLNNVDLTAVKVRKVADKHGHRWRVTFSTRDKTRDEGTDTKDRVDLSRYNRAVEGASYPINVSGGRQPVEESAQVPYRMDVYYPGEVVSEQRLKLRIIGQPYRAYSRGADSAVIGEPFRWHKDYWEYGDIESTSSSDPYRLQVTAPVNIQGWAGGTYVDFQVFNQTGNEETYNWEVYTAHDDNTFDSGQFDVFSNDIHYQTVEGPGDISNASVTLDLWGGDIGTNSGAPAKAYVMMMLHFTDDHSHNPNPGVIEFNEYPSDLTVNINGTQVASGIQSGNTSSFEEVLDIKGELNQGQINTIEVESATKGHLTCYVEGDVYRQILGNG